MIKNDPNPLSASPNALRALDEMGNEKQWLRNEIISYSSRPSLTQDDIKRKVEVLMACKLVAKLNNRMVENTFGMALHHAMTEEPISDGFNLLIIYNIDRTDAGRCSYLAQTAPCVNIVNVERKVSPPGSTRVNIRIDKDVFQKMGLALGAIEGSWLKMKNERLAMGLPAKPPLGDPNLKIAESEYQNFMSQIEVRLNAAANSIIRGQNTHSFQLMVDQSPSVTTLPRNTRFKDVMDRRELVRRSISIIPQMSFGINKMAPMRNSDRKSVSMVLHDVLRIFDLHTDNSGAIDGLDGWFDGPKAPFKKPDVIAFTTSRVIDRLQLLGVVSTEEVNMNQTMTVLTLEDEDMHPMRTVVPQRSVVLKNGSYVRDPDTQLAKKVITTKNHKIEYARVGNRNVVFVPIDDGSMANDIATASHVTTLTNFDFAIPTGVTFTQHGKTLHGPVRQCTTFANETGARYTLSCDQLKSFFYEFFSDDEPFDCSSFDDIDTALKCMMFYSQKPNEDEEEEQSSECHERNCYEEVIEKNELMRDNYYYNNDLMAHNIISIMLNRTSPALKSLFDRDHKRGSSKKQSKFHDDENEPRKEYKRHPSKECLINIDNSDSRFDQMEATEKPPSTPSDNLQDIEKKKHDESEGSDDCDDFNAEVVKAIVKNYMVTKQMSFNETDFNRIYRVLYNLSNHDAVEYLGYINTGFGVIWIKPTHVQADGIMFCRPSGYAHFGGTPIQKRMQDLSDESNSLLLQSVAYSTTSRQSIANYPSLMWNNATYIESVTSTTNKVIDVTDQSEIVDAINSLHAIASADLKKKTFDPEIDGNGWWPLLCPPFMEMETMSKPFSPLGRMGTQFKTEEEHSRCFTDENIMDAVYPNVFTTNAVHQDMWNNFNTICLYSKELFNNPDFPFYKYIHFNPTADEGIRATEDAITRDNNRRMNMLREDTVGVRVKGESSLSDFMGAAIPKTCWSDTELGGVMSREDFKAANSYRVNAILTKGDTSFFINGDDLVGKWDRCGVSEYSFLN